MAVYLVDAELRVKESDRIATTAAAYREFLAQGGLDARIQAQLDALDVDDVNTLARVGADIRGAILAQPFQSALDQAIDVLSFSSSCQRYPKQAKSIELIITIRS